MTQLFSIQDERLDFEIPLKPRLDDLLVASPGFVAGGDDVVASTRLVSTDMRANTQCPGSILTEELGQNTMRYLLLITALLVHIFVLENLGDILGALNQDVPLCPKEDLDGAVLQKWPTNVLFERLFLVHVEKERQEYNLGTVSTSHLSTSYIHVGLRTCPEWHRGYVARMRWWMQKAEVQSSNKHHGQQDGLQDGVE